MISIIIPTLNEERQLPLLLRSIKKQSFLDKEIIIADNNSQDRTIKIAKSFGCKIVQGGRPAKGRNQGAKAAKGDIFFFLDADTVLLEKDFLEKALREFNKRNLNMAGCFILPFRQSRFLKLIFNFFHNWPSLLVERIFPFASGFIMAKKEIHEEIGGFDQEAKICEDTLYTATALRSKKFRMLRTVKIIFSERRFKREGWIKAYLKVLFGYLHTFFFGPVKSDIFNYKFGHSYLPSSSKKKKNDD